MLHDRAIADGNEWLGSVGRDRPQPRTFAACHDHRFHTSIMLSPWSQQRNIRARNVKDSLFDASGNASISQYPHSESLKKVNSLWIWLASCYNETS